MTTITSTPNKTLRITGWGISTVISLLFIFSAYAKFFPSPEVIEQTKAIGITVDVFKILGFIELVTVALFLYPRTGVLGSLLLMCYLGGVMATHLVVHQPLAIPIVLQILVWVSAAIRFPELTARLKGLM